MSHSKKDLEYKKNKLEGGVKEAVGKETGDEQLELKGKIQSSKADLKKKTNIKDKAEDVKENIAGKINKKIDKNKKKK